MQIKTESGEEIDASHYVDQVIENIKNERRDPFQQTPIITNPDGREYWYADFDEFIDLEKGTAKAFLKFCVDKSLKI